MQHTIIGRQSQSAPHNFITLEHQNVEGQWDLAPRTDLASTFEACIKALVGRFVGQTGIDIKNTTITSRDVSEIQSDLPLIDQDYREFLNTQPGVSLTVFCPIKHAEPRDRYEMWTVINRDVHGLSGQPLPHCSGQRRYIVRVIGDQILTQFNAGENRPAYSTETFKQFAAQGARRNEIWIRPHWEAATFFPEAFPDPKPLPTYTPEFLDKRARDAKVRQSIRQHKSMRASQGLIWSEKRQSWGKP